MNVNPFQKPNSGSTVQTESLEGYQPFQNANSSGGNSTAGSSSVNNAGDSKKMYEDLEKKQKELDARAADLDRREREQSHLLNNATANNFPPLPSFCPLKPCFYQDIQLEIPPQYVGIVKRGYHLWLALCVICVVNFGTSLGYLIAATDKNMAGSTFGSAILVLILCPPAAYVCWFRPLYRAFRSDSSVNFFIFFFVMLAQIIVTIVQALGIYWLGSCGWLNGLMMIKTNKIAGILMVCTAVFFTVLATFEIIIFLKVHRLYRNTDASFEKAKSEFGVGAATSLLHDSSQK